MTTSISDQVEVSSEKAEALNGTIVLIKYGGNAMVIEDYKQAFIRDIGRLQDMGVIPVIVHGGGPAIKDLLEKVGIESEFIGGHRKTDKEAMGYVEMALNGKVNSELVKLLNQSGHKAVGISGKDGDMVKAGKRLHEVTIDGEQKQVDLGQVGDVRAIDTSLVHTLIKAGYIPVIAPIGVGEDLLDYNINADMFAGHMAGALKAANYMVLTDVDGLMKDKNDPETLIDHLTIQEANSEMGHIIQGGMIPKIESCIIALQEGVKSTHIVNGMKEYTMLKAIFSEEFGGTRLVQS